MIHVYGVTDCTDLREPIDGIGGATVDLVAVSGLGVAVTQHDASIPADTEAVVAHATVCDTLMTRGCTVLPVRFGSRYADEPSLRSAVDERRDHLTAGLERVRGRVEIGVRVAWVGGADDDEPPDTDGPADSGTAYLHRRLAAEQRRAAREAAAREVADDIHGSLSRQALDARSRVLASPGMVLSAAYLVAMKDVDDFTRAVAALSESRTDVQLLCTGPWPPYNFVEGGAV